MSEGPFSFSQIQREELRRIFPAGADLSKIERLAADALPHRAPEEQKKAADIADRRRLAGVIDTLETPLAALCLSGGGIRSASFALGALQALARFDLLGQFHYLSTVSGGGYIGGWLSAWRHHAQNDTDVFEKLNALERTGNEPGEIKGIRANSNYLTPRLGLFSADTWTVIALYIRNLLLNWLVFAPFFMGILFAFPLFMELLDEASGFSRATVWLVLLSGGGIAVTIGQTAAVSSRLKPNNPRLDDGGYLLFAALPMFVAALCFSLVPVTGYSPGVETGLHLEGLGFGALSYGTAWVVAAIIMRRRGVSAHEPLKKRAADFLEWTAGGALAGWILFWGFDIAVNVTGQPNVITIFGFGWCVLSTLVGELLYIGLSSFSPHGDMDREWLARSAGWLSAIALSWGLVAAVSIYGPEALRRAWGWLAGIGGVSGLVTIFLGSSARTVATTGWKAVKSLKLSDIVSLAAVVFALFLLAVLSLADQELVEWLDTLLPSWSEGGLEVLAALLLLGVAVLISLLVNVNRFSLHAVYRNRLIRAFLGSARASCVPSRDATADPFTSFDPEDNLQMKDLVPAARDTPVRLFHIVNMALNVVSPSNLAWQERKAESFTVTPLSSGSPIVGYRDTAHFGAGLRLGTAVAISGAAVSPNQGYHSSPLVGFLLMLFNVRLGWWLGNPKKSSYSDEGPRFGLQPALEELAGMTTDNGRWVYLSDGGHFENLGIYEMVRRRCRCIVVSDAGADPACAFEDLGNAVRKSFIDLGVSINFKTLEIKARQDPPVPGVYCAIGHISYPGDGPEGWLIYVKPGYHGTEPADIRSYAQAHQTFPHEPTTDQWFSESQLESYRALGAHVFEQILTAGKGVEPGQRTGRIEMKSMMGRVSTYLSTKAGEFQREKTNIANSIDALEKTMKAGLSSIHEAMQPD